MTDLLEILTIQHGYLPAYIGWQAVSFGVLCLWLVASAFTEEG